jgi:hypothetical protein
MQRLDYETPQKPQHKRSPFWLAFFGAYYFPGVILLAIADDMLHRRLGRGGSDGGIECISLFFSPLFAGAVAAIKNVFRRYDTIRFAIAFGAFAPLIAFLVFLLVILNFA